jgi:alkylated DNA repair dioxygenase AlkB
MGEPSAVPGLRYLPDWLDATQELDLLARIDAAPWSTELRRRVQHYGHQYDYGRRAVAAAVDAVPPVPGWARALAVRLHTEGHLGDVADQVIVNEYLPGQGISPHVDCVSCFGPAVASISLGSPCTMEFVRPTRSERRQVWLEPRGLCVMTGEARYRWRHGIPARRSDPAPGGGRVPRERRVSVTFRTVLSERPPTVD